MHGIRKKSVLSGKGAVVIAMAFLFSASLLWFSMQKCETVPLPVINPAAQNDDMPGTVLAAAPGDWATNLLSIELSACPIAQTEQGYITASLEDPDWAPEQSQAGDEKEVSGTTNITPIANTGTGPMIMLYSTHSNESYRMVDTQAYKELNNSRTLDDGYNILRVNRELSTLLIDTYHLPVFFCSTDHEQGKYYTTSYERSLSSINQAVETYPTLAVFFDIHRDSAGEGLDDDVVMVDGKPCARVMFVVGTGEGKTGTGFKVKPNWESNLAFAQLITDEINRIAPGLCRDVRINTGRYNQHVSDTAVAIEVGHNQNTLQEALNAVPYLAQAIYNVLTEDLDIPTVSVP